MISHKWLQGSKDYLCKRNVYSFSVVLVAINMKYLFYIGQDKEMWAL